MFVLFYFCKVDGMLNIKQYFSTIDNETEDYKQYIILWVTGDAGMDKLTDNLIITNKISDYGHNCKI
jgi:hypothetical protein